MCPDSTGSRLPFSHIRSPISGTSAAVGARIDPFYDGLWVQGSQGFWARSTEARRQSAAGLGRMPKIASLDVEQAWESVMSNYRWNEKLAVLSAVDAFRTITVQQAQAITGAESMLTGTNVQALSALFAAGLIDLGRSAAALVPTEAASLGYLLRPSRTKAFDRQLAPHLTYPEIVSITGGLGWQAGGYYDRHNVLSAELILRAAEMCDIATVLGEKYATHDLLFGTGVGRPAIESASRGDGVIVRADGLRIVLEVTTSLSPKAQATKEKFARWARLFEKAPFDSNGVVVVFVIANPPGAQVSTPVTPKQVRALVAEAIESHPGSGRVRSKDRFFIADFTSWFPAPGVVDESFFTLRAQKAIKRPDVARNATGEEVDLLDIFDVAGPEHPRFDPLAIVANAAGLRCTPTWIRARSSPPQILDALIDRSGLAHLPVSPRRDGSGPGRVAAAGVAGPAQPVQRMQTLTHNSNASTLATEASVAKRSRLQGDSPATSRHRNSEDIGRLPAAEHAQADADWDNPYTGVDQW